jgi:hypothetical protein
MTEQLGSLEARFVISKRGQFLVDIEGEELSWSIVINEAFDSVFSWDNTQDAIEIYNKILEMGVFDATLTIVFRRLYVKGWRVISQQGLRIPEERHFETPSEAA